jgi:hypothetical protein
MSNAPPQVIEPAGPRRRFSVAEKLAIVAETRQPGVHFVDIAWRQETLVELGVIGIPGASELPSFIAIEMRDRPGAVVKPERSD